jgi:hypothetical protein
MCPQPTALCEQAWGDIDPEDRGPYTEWLEANTGATDNRTGRPALINLERLAPSGEQ